MKKIIVSVFVIIVIMMLGYVLFIQNFELFPSNRIELVEFRANGFIYKIYSFEGNATVSSNIQLYQNKVMLGFFNTVDFYSQGEIIKRNDSTMSLLISNKEADLLQDTVSVKFVEPVNFKILE